MRKIIAVTAMLLFFCPYFARADTAPSPVNIEVPKAPDIEGWRVVTTSRIKLLVSDDIVVYLGLEVEYNDPNDPDNHVKVIRRHIPLAISRNKKTDSRLLREAAVGLYLQKEENERLKEVTAESDDISYAQWRTMKNPITGLQDKLDGDVNIWFLPANGKWIFVKNESIGREFMTENINSDRPDKKPYNVFSAMGYRVGDAYHIIRVDRSILVFLAAKEKKS